tara:strand:- start:702 stop:950 length:249 start_codon:yes stop_codon:yes gene_type:complete
MIIDIKCKGFDVKLDDWRKSKKLSYAKLAKLVGQNEATVARRWCMPPGHPNQLIPRKGKNMDRIIEVTQGSVMPNDFYLEDR